MASEHSFDITAEVDMQELKNAINQAKKEIETRFDFKDDKAKDIDINEKDKKVVITANTDNKLNSIRDVLNSKLVKRDLSLKVLKEDNIEGASGGTIRATYVINDSMPQDVAKSITKHIKSMKTKAQANIQGDEIRVKSKSIDELQSIMSEVKAMDIDIAVSFKNMK